METTTDETFEGQTVELDGRTFVRCRFVDSTVVISGEADFGVDDCDFQRTRFQFTGPALRTVRLARQLKASGLDIIGG